MKTCLIVLSCILGCALAFPDGAPNCNFQRPGHGDRALGLGPIGGEYLITKHPSGEKASHYVIAVMTPKNSFKGLTLRVNGTDVRQEAVQAGGTWTVGDNDLFQNKGDECVTHKDNSVKVDDKVPYMFTFDAKDASQELFFEVFVVGEKKEIWWKTIV